jgi:hypothetical protein
MRIRKLLRQLYPNLAPGTGGRWELTEEQVQAVRDYYADAGPRTTPAVGSAGIATGPPVATASRDVPADWFWEGRVQDKVVAYLRREGWIITAESDTAMRAQGYDIAASKGARRLVVEVKGYPSTGYRDPRRANEVKRTNPTLQAKHWFADALLKMVRLSGQHPQLELAMAFPDAPRYRTLTAETREPLRRLGVAIVFVLPDGRVEQAEPGQGSLQGS